MTAKRTFAATTALVLCIPASVVAQQPAKPAFGSMAVQVRQQSAETPDPNARLFSWFGWRPSRNAGTLLYAQSASSDFARYGIWSWGVSGSALCRGCFNPMAADDFVVPGTGQYTISAVYAPGDIYSGLEPTHIFVTFYNVLKYSRKTGKTIVETKATCDTKSYSDMSGHGNFLVDVSSCNLGTFKGGHDYSVSVQAWFWSNGSWAWQTNRNQVKRQAFFVGNDGNGPCNAYFAPVKTCFTEKGYGRDMAFAIYGEQG